MGRGPRPVARPRLVDKGAYWTRGGGGTKIFIFGAFFAGVIFAKGTQRKKVFFCA